MITNADITLYNAYYFAGDVVYSRMVILGVRWFGRTKTAPSAEGLVSSNECIIRVPLSAHFDKQYVEPSMFAKVDPMKFFTFKPGDVCVHGLNLLVNPTKDALMKQSSEVVTLIGVTDNRVGSANMQHWKLVADTPHV